MAEPGSRGEVVIVGGGVAALETLMALRDLAADAVSLSLVAAEPEFVYRPMSVAEPFGLGEARRYPLRRVVDDFGAVFVQASVVARAALRDDLFSLHAELTADVLRGAGAGVVDADRRLDAWIEANRPLVERCLGIMADIRTGGTFDLTTLPVALRELRNLLQGSAASVGAPA